MNKNTLINRDSALMVLAKQIRAKRKALGVNATALAEAAGISRVTLHRIEVGEPTVSMGAYMDVLAALGMNLGEAFETRPPLKNFIPVRISVEQYPQLKKLAWQLKAGADLTPLEAFGIYERNARHIDLEMLDAGEKELIEQLTFALGGGASHV
jgi:transcriptional regulator with XRE-family HTH domain